MGPDARQQQAERDDGADEPDEQALEDERPADEASEAPTSRMISISSARDISAMRMVLTTISSTVRPTTASTPNPTVRSVAVTLDQLVDVVLVAR